MRLGWQEIRRRAKDFSVRWKDAHYEKGETQTFYNELFQIFGIDRKRVAIFERKIELIDAQKRGYIDLFWPSVLLVEQKSAGKDLFKAGQQADDYVLGLRDRDIPRYVLVCDFQRFRLRHLETGKEVSFTLPELHKNVEEFGFMLGVERRHYGRQAAVNIKAAELLGTIHDALQAKGYRGGDLERLMVRLLFCLFADDTGIFESKDDFLYLIEERTDEDGGNVGAVLNQLFEVLDTPHEERLEGADPEFDKFPYVNGRLFSGHLRTAVFDAEMRDDLLAAAKFDWGKVSPAIFGSLFQSVMDKEERRKKGAHYTTEPNIMKLISPLFLDELRAEFERLRSRRDGSKRAALLAFQEKLGGLQFFDPACGCGNFLVVTYRELRRLEQEVLELVFDPNSPMLYEVEALSVLKLDHFHGIELEEFPAHIAEVAMWMTEHLANIELGRTFGKVFADIPLRDSAHIVHGDALEIDWEEILPHEQCFAIMGNPPFVGAKYQTPEQRAQIKHLLASGRSKGTLDYVSGWFLKAGAYISRGRTHIGFVATNSITQGEQVAQLWPVLFDRFGLEIAFAHRTFAWGSDARGKARVHVVIIGLNHRDYQATEKRLFSYERPSGDPDESRHPALTAYLFGTSAGPTRHLVVAKSTRPIDPSTKKSRIGSKPIDGGYLIFDATERALLKEEGGSAHEFLRPFVGSKDVINGSQRWIATLQSASPESIESSAILKRRVEMVQDYRDGKIRAKGKTTGKIKKPGTSARKLASTPTQFHVTVIPKKSFLALPSVSSEKREYVPFDWVSPPVVPSNLVNVVLDAELTDFALLISRMHMSWLSHIGGRLESRYRYSIGQVYNTFPRPLISDKQKKELEQLAESVLTERARWPSANLAHLYNPKHMPAGLRKAHSQLDAAVDRLYRKKAFDSDLDRVEHLFKLYETLVQPTSSAPAANIRTKRRTGRVIQKAAA